MRISFGLGCFLSVAALGACDDSGPVPGGESGSIADDDDGGETSGTSGVTGVSTTTDSTDPTTDPATTTPTPTTMDPTNPSGSDSGDSSGDPSETMGCDPGTQGCACDGGQCNDGLTCSDEVCVLDVNCGVDIYEDNNTEDAAADLGTISDDDDDAVTITAVLEGDEVDWFVYFGDDQFLASVNPARTLTTAGALRMCKFVECETGLFGTEVTCPDGTVSTMSPEGRPGCCGDDTFEIELGCDSMNDNASVYLRFDQGLGDCTQYTLEYHY